MTLPGLDQLRADIDAVDRQILELLSRRLQLVLQVGELKRAHNAPVYDAERERRVLDHLAASAKPPLEAATARRVFERIIDESRSHEQRHIAEPTD